MQQLPVVVVDTTTTQPDLQLHGSAWRQLLDHSERGVVRLFVPEVVVRESERHFFKKMTLEAKTSVSGIHALKALGFGDQALPSETAVGEQAQAEKDAYRYRLLHTLSEHGARLLPLPSTSHDDLTRWDLDGRKPFKNNGTGYRDALIWASVVELCTAEPEAGALLFVTDNHNDFCDEDGDKLAQQLAAELPAGWSAQRFKNLKSLNGMLAAAQDNEPVTTDDSTSAQSSGLEEQTGKLLAEAVAKACRAFHYSPVMDPRSGDKYETGLDFTKIDLPWADLENVTLTYAEPDLTTLMYTRTGTLASGDLVVDIAVEADVTLDGYVDKATAYHVDDEPGPLQVYDFDWNDHMSNVTAELRAILEFTAYLDPSAGDIVKVEFEQALPTEDSGQGTDA